MGYADYLKSLLRPMRLYNVDDGPGECELAADGAELDAVFVELAGVETEMLLPTAQGAGLAKYEDVLPYHPSYITLGDRRRAIMALLRIDDCSFTPDALNDTLSGCGLKAVVSETGERCKVRVSFPDNRGVPDAFAELKVRIEAILPCHLDIEYYIIYITWQELENWFITWGMVEDMHFTWDAIERYKK